MKYTTITLLILFVSFCSCRKGCPDELKLTTHDLSILSYVDAETIKFADTSGNVVNVSVEKRRIYSEAKPQEKGVCPSENYEAATVTLRGNKSLGELMIYVCPKEINKNYILAPSSVTGFILDEDSIQNNVLVNGVYYDYVFVTNNYLDRYPLQTIYLVPGKGIIKCSEKNGNEWVRIY